MVRIRDPVWNKPTFSVLQMPPEDMFSLPVPSIGEEQAWQTDKGVTTPRLGEPVKPGDYLILPEAETGCPVKEIRSSRGE